MIPHMDSPQTASLLSVAQAIAIIDSTAVKPTSSRVTLDGAVGLRLAENLVADRDYPPFNKSLMDGYAIRCADVTAGSRELRVIGEVAAGGSSMTRIEPGQAIAIMTGAPVPAGADGVVPVEEVESKAPAGSTIRIIGKSVFERFIAAQGSDCPAGRLLLSAATLIGPAQIAVMASIGVTRPLCFARPRVAILSTGDELVDADQFPGPSQIRNSNSPMIAALLTKLGCEVAHVAHVPDDRERLRQAIADGMNADALFITGGMSMGDYDYVPPILVELGVELRITKLRIKPGKPFVFGVTAGGHFVFGLPGNPVSAYVSTMRLASRLLARLAGGEARERWISGRLADSLAANGSREFYQPCIVDKSTLPLATVTPIGWKGSADIFTLALANGLLVRKEHEAEVGAGETVRVLEIE